MIKEGLELMVVGMGVVSSFLVLLVLLMKTSGYLFNKTPEQVTESPAASATGNNSSQKMAIAIAAAYQHQRGKNNQ